MKVCFCVISLLFFLIADFSKICASGFEDGLIISCDSEDSHCFVVNGINSDENEVSIPFSLGFYNGNFFTEKLWLEKFNNDDYYMTRKIPNRISKRAFAFKNFRKIHLPRTIGIIEDEAFSECKNLDTVTFEGYEVVDFFTNYGSSSCFYNGMKNRLKIIGRCAFNKTNLSFFRILPTVKTISEYAFCDCKNLKEIYFECCSELENIENCAFKNTLLKKLELPSSLKTMERAFSECRNLKNVIFQKESNLQNIGSYSFNFASIKSIEIPKSVESIGEGAFEKCDKLKDIIFEDNSNLKSLGKRAFAGSAITKIKIPKSVVHVDSTAFEDCPYLNYVVIEKGSNLEVLFRDGAWRFDVKK